MASPSERAMDDVKYYYALANDQPFHLPSDLSACMHAMDLRGPAFISPFVTSIERARPLVFEALAKSDAVKDYRDKDGASALHKIFGVRNATAHHVNVICQNIDPNVTEYPSLDKPIHYAAHYLDRNGMLEALLAQPNIEVNAQTAEGLTPAHVVANVFKKEVNSSHDDDPSWLALKAFASLEKAGADFSLKDNQGQTPITVLRQSPIAETKGVSEFIARHEAQQSKAALLAGLDKEFVPCEQQPTQQRRRAM